MSSRSITLYVILTLTLTLIPTLTFSQIGNLNSLESTHLAWATEIGTKTAVEWAHGENANVQNDFSPAGMTPNATRSTTESGPSTKLSLSSLIAQGSPVFGSRSAPITIIEFGDFQCHFCDRFAKQTEPTINSKYLQTDKVNLVFKHFVTHGQDSFSAAIASQCAHDQGKFWNFYETL